MKPKVKRIRADIELVTADQPIHFALDSANWTRDASAALMLTGWAVHPKNSVQRVRLLQEEHVVAQAPVSLSRPGVGARYPDHIGAGSSGFRLEAGGLSEGGYHLEACVDAAEPVKLADIRLREASRPRVLFVHIPKTAGSSFNSWLSGKFEQDRFAIHVESLPQWFSHVEHFRNFDFVSGHLTLTHFERRLNIADYYCVTFVREPYAQLASHLAWIRKL